MSRSKAVFCRENFLRPSLQLSTLFHIELWERFSFYGMQGILLIYLYYTASQGGLGMDKALAGGIVGAVRRQRLPVHHSRCVVGRPHLGCGAYPVYRRHRRDDRPYFIGDRTGFDGIAAGLGVYRTGQRRREIVCQFDGRFFV